MRDAGVNSFAKMAKSSPKKLEKILDAVDLQMHSPDTWPQQAELAAAGPWFDPIPLGLSEFGRLCPKVQVFRLAAHLFFTGPAIGVPTRTGGR